MCCVLALGADSLSSAETSVGAKPNHGFFNCQHPCTIFFTATASGDGRAFRLQTAVGRWSRVHRRWHRTRQAKNSAQIKLFFAFAEHRAACTAATRSLSAAHACVAMKVYEDCPAGRRQRPIPAPARVDFGESAQKKRAARTDRNDAIMCRAERDGLLQDIDARVCERFATVRDPGADDRISVRLPRAVRRSRRVPATRSVGRARRSRRRRSSLRRRRPR